MRRERLVTLCAVVAIALTSCAAPAATQPTGTLSPIIASQGPSVPNVVPASAVVPTPSATPKSKPPRKKREVVSGVAETVMLAKDPMVEEILAEGGPALKKVLASPDSFRFQVLYAPVEDGKLERHGYRADAEYFFPASSMKVPIAFATIGRSGIGREAALRLFPLSGNGDAYTTTIARETWRALIVSDNFSANRLLAIGGHREIHEMLWATGLKSARVRSGFATGADLDPAELSPKIEVGGREIPPRKSDLVLPPTEATGLDIGKASIVDGRRVEGPLSFANKNAMRLRELQDTLVRIMRPDLVNDTSLSAEDRAYLQKTLGTLPSESGLAGYDRNVVADYQLNPFLRGIERVLPRGTFKVYSKVGQAFGFLIANAYIVEIKTGRAFFLAAAIFANPDEVMNDDLYSYDTIAFPVLADVGEAFTRNAFE